MLPNQFIDSWCRMQATARRQRHPVACSPQCNDDTSHCATTRHGQVCRRATSGRGEEATTCPTAADGMVYRCRKMLVCFILHTLAAFTRSYKKSYSPDCVTRRKAAVFHSSLSVTLVLVFTLCCCFLLKKKKNKNFFTNIART